MSFHRVNQTKKNGNVKKKQFNLMYFATTDFHGHGITAKMKIQTWRSVTHAKTGIIESVRIY